MDGPLIGVRHGKRHFLETKLGGFPNRSADERRAHSAALEFSANRHLRNVRRAGPHGGERDNSRQPACRDVDRRK